MSVSHNTGGDVTRDFRSVRLRCSGSRFGSRKPLPRRRSPTSKWYSMFFLWKPVFRKQIIMSTYHNLPLASEHFKKKWVRKRIEDLKLAEKAQPTVYRYVRTVRKPAVFSQPFPNQMAESDASELAGMIDPDRITAGFAAIPSGSSNNCTVISVLSLRSNAGESLESLSGYAVQLSKVSAIGRQPSEFERSNRKAYDHRCWVDFPVRRSPLSRAFQALRNTT